MLSIFPSLLTYGLLAPLILRVVLGLVFIHTGYHKLASKSVDGTNKPPRALVQSVALIQIITGLALFVGLYTQIAALVVILLTIWFLIIKLQGKNPSGYPVHIILIILAIAFSLLFSGAGFLAFDLPL